MAFSWSLISAGDEWTAGDLLLVFSVPVFRGTDVYSMYSVRVLLSLGVLPT